MNDSQIRASKIDAYGQAYEHLTAALESFPRSMWHFKSADDPWSIHDVIVHISDSEANSYVRCRRCIAEPGESVMAYDENGWVTQLDYANQDADEALELFKWLRLRTYRLLLTLPAHLWAHTIQHPENGTMTLDDWLDVYQRHVPEHIEQMQRIYQAYCEQNGNTH